MTHRRKKTIHTFTSASSSFLSRRGAIEVYTSSTIEFVLLLLLLLLLLPATAPRELLSTVNRTSRVLSPSATSLYHSDASSDRTGPMAAATCDCTTATGSLEKIPFTKSNASSFNTYIIVRINLCIHKPP